MSDDFMKEFTIEQLRLQRHEFMNFLQVIFGYIQINRPQEAVNYIKKVNKKMSVLSQLFNLNCSDFALLMQDLIIQCNKFGIEIDFDSDLEYIPDEVFSKNIIEKSKLFIRIKDIIVNEMGIKDEIVFSRITDENEKIRIIFSNKEELESGNFDACEMQTLVKETEQGIELYLYRKEEDFLIVFDNY